MVSLIVSILHLKFCVIYYNRRQDLSILKIIEKLTKTSSIKQFLQLFDTNVYQNVIKYKIPEILCSYPRVELEPKCFPYSHTDKQAFFK